MSIYFQNRSPRDPLYQNEDYRKQQKQFITVLRTRTNSFSLKVGHLNLTDAQGNAIEPAFLNIDLRDVRRVTVSLPNARFRSCLHELFEVWSQNPEAHRHIVHEHVEIRNLEEILAACYDILTVKFEQDWMLSDLELGYEKDAS